MAQAPINIISEEAYGHGVRSTLGNDEVGMALRRLDIHLVHRLEDVLIAVDHHLGSPAALHTVAGNDADQAVIGIGIDKHFDVHHLPQRRVVEDEDTLYYHHIAGLDAYRLLLTCAGKIAIGGHLDGMALAEEPEMLGQEAPFYGGRLVEVDFASLLGGYMAGILIVGVLRDDGHFPGGEGRYYFVDDGGLSRPRTAGYTYDKHK